MLVDTAGGFQGDERHVVLFSLVGGPDMPAGSARFLAQTPNRLNVAAMNGNWDARVEEWIAERPKLKRRNVELEAFAEIVAHDLKKPLRGIRHCVGFALQDCGSGLPEQIRPC